MNKTCSALLLVFVASLWISCQLNNNQDTAGPPNIIFIFIDDMGYADLSSYGNKEMQTPNIDRLAGEGIKFTNAYVPSPICSPARVGVTTGHIHPGGIFTLFWPAGKEMKNGAWPITWIRRLLP